MSNSEIQTSIPKAKLYDSYADTVKTCSSKCNFHCKEENFYDSDASTISSFVSSPPEKESRNSGNLLPIKTNVTNIKPEAMVETDLHESSSMKEQMLSMSKHIMELAESNLHLQEVLNQYIVQGCRNREGAGGTSPPPPVFGRSVYPVSTGRHIMPTALLFSDLVTTLHTMHFLHLFQT